MSSYVDITEGDDYFALKLHASYWEQADNTTKEKALAEATQIIDRLGFAGYKAATWAVVDAGGSDSEIEAAEASQELQFPRGTDTEVPQKIKDACCEIAYKLIEEPFDPDVVDQNLGLVSQGFASVRATYDRTKSSSNLAAGVPSVIAWRLLTPFLRDTRGVRISRV